MRRILMIGVLLDAATITAHAQTIETLVLQLASLDRLQKTTHDGIMLLGKKLSTLGDAGGGEFRQTENYFLSLTQKNPTLDQSSEAATILHLQNVLIEELMHSIQYWTDEKSFKIKEE